MNTQEGMGLIVSLASAHAARRKRTRDAIYAEMYAEIVAGNVDGAVELSQELKNWSSK